MAVPITSLTKELLEDLYLERKMTIQQICDATGVKSPITVAKYMKRHGIKARDINRERANETMKGMSDDQFKKYLTRRYLDESQSVIAIAKEVGVSHTIINRYFKKYGIVALDHKQANARFNSGSRNPKWNGGTRKHEGYVQIYCPSHPFADGCGYVYEHRLVMEQSIGRLLQPEEVVHHINHIKNDNRIENLMLFKSQSEHTAYHAEERQKGVIYG